MSRLETENVELHFFLVMPLNCLYEGIKRLEAHTITTESQARI